MQQRKAEAQAADPDLATGPAEGQGQGQGQTAVAWKREALRLCDRYIQEIVLGFGLCPWAEPALRSGRVGREVSLSPAPPPAACLPFIDGLAAADTPSLDIGLLIFPRHAGGSSAFDAFAESVRRADTERRARLGTAAGARFFVAAFHPEGATTFVGPHQLVSFVRRTPDPLLQFVRVEMLDRVKAKQPDASEAVARRNHEVLVGEKSARLDVVVRAIRADRDASYARLSPLPT